MTAVLSAAARRFLAASNEFSEVSDDSLVLGASGITVLLCRRAIEDLNRQARDADEPS